MHLHPVVVGVTYETVGVGIRNARMSSNFSFVIICTFRNKMRDIVSNTLHVIYMGSHKASESVLICDICEYEKGVNSPY